MTIRGAVHEVQAVYPTPIRRCNAQPKRDARPVSLHASRNLHIGGTTMRSGRRLRTGALPPTGNVGYFEKVVSLGLYGFPVKSCSSARENSRRTLASRRACTETDQRLLSVL